MVRWGLVPFWAKDPKIGSRLINARAETVAVQARVPARVQAPPVPAARRRLLRVAAAGRLARTSRAGQGGGAGAGGAKQPYFITRGDGGPLAFAGLYELWRDAALPEDHERAWLWTATIITTSAPDELGQIHDRMPMVIEPDRWADWLDPASDDPADAGRAAGPGGLGRADLVPGVDGGQLGAEQRPGADRAHRARPARPGCRPGRTERRLRQIPERGVPRNLWQRPRQAALTPELNRPGGKDIDRRCRPYADRRVGIRWIPPSLASAWRRSAPSSKGPSRCSRASRSRTSGSWTIRRIRPTPGPTSPNPSVARRSWPWPGCSARRWLDALRRIELGTYGTCLDCGAGVPEGRLEARPEAARCVKCQAKWDRLRR